MRISDAVGVYVLHGMLIDTTLVEKQNLKLFNSVRQRDPTLRPHLITLIQHHIRPGVVLGAFTWHARTACAQTQRLLLIKGGKEDKVQHLVNRGLRESHKSRKRYPMRFCVWPTPRWLFNLLLAWIYWLLKSLCASSKEAKVSL